MTNATELLNSLSLAEISARLDEIDAEAQALRVLLRAARKRERSRRDRKEEAADAS